MSRLLFSTTAALVVTFAGATQSFADSGQLAASAGLTPSEAAGMTLDDVARTKFNADTRRDDRIAIVPAGSASDPRARSQLIASAGISADDAAQMSLGEIATVKFNSEADRDDRHVVVSARSAPADSTSRSQLAAATGLPGTSSMQALFVAKIEADNGRDQQLDR